MGLNPQVNSPLVRRPRAHAHPYWFNKTKQHTQVLLGKSTNMEGWSSDMSASLVLVQNLEMITFEYLY